MRKIIDGWKREILTALATCALTVFVATIIGYATIWKDGVERGEAIKQVQRIAVDTNARVKVNEVLLQDTRCNQMAVMAVLADHIPGAYDKLMKEKERILKLELEALAKQREVQGGNGSSLGTVGSIPK